MASKKKRTRKPAARPIGKTARLFHKVVRTDEAARRRLYAEGSIGRVRCYKYKYGKSRPNPATQKQIEKLTRGAVKAPWV